MICIKANIPQKICDINDELKAIYHNKESICIWIFKNKKDRDSFMKETIGMQKNERQAHYIKFYNF